MQQLDYLDHDRERLRIAEALGARDRASARRGGAYPISVDASSNAAGLRFARRSLAPGGRCTSVGYHLRSTRLPLMQRYANCSTLHVGMARARASGPSVTGPGARRRPGCPRNHWSVPAYRPYRPQHESSPCAATAVA